jgi:hypothetical protein
MGKFGKELIESMQQAARHAAGKNVRGVRVSKVELPDAKAIRLSLRMSSLSRGVSYSAFHTEKLGARTAQAGRSCGRLSAGDQAASEGNHGSCRPAMRRAVEWQQVAD